MCILVELEKPSPTLKPHPVNSPPFPLGAEVAKWAKLQEFNLLGTQ